jgi:hypothetical protein
MDDEERNEASRRTQWNVVIVSTDSKQQSIELARVNSLKRDEKIKRGMTPSLTYFLR